MNEKIIEQLSKEMQLYSKQIESVLQLLEQGNTVPFIARYRKEVTGALDEEKIRVINESYQYQVNLERRKEDVIRLIDEKGMLDDDIRQAILQCEKLSEVESLYKPYKEKKKTRASEAKAKGLEPLAQWILRLPKYGDLEAEAKKYLNDQVLTCEEALLGARDIIAEWVVHQPRFHQFTKDMMYKTGILSTKEKKSHQDDKRVYQMYYQFEERVSKIAPHRILAIHRAENEKVITVNIEIDTDRFLKYIQQGVLRNKETIVKDILLEAIEDGFKRLLRPSVEREIRLELLEKAQKQALDIFSINLERLLMQAPLKDRVVLGVDPAFRTGCKLAVVDETGKVLNISKIYPTIPKSNYDQDEKIVLDLISQYHVQIIVIGNGTASRETETFISSFLEKYHLKVPYAIVSEAGASVYSASPLAKEEFPDLQVEERSAISIARRVQDPLAELVKIEPKSMSVGQYQHDMNQKHLEERLDFVVEKAVNQVGVNINTASPSLLQYVAGLTKSMAKSIVDYREKHGRFYRRSELKDVPRIGEKSYQQAVGFLRILDGHQPLDETAIHPESYTIALDILQQLEMSVDAIGTNDMIEKLDSFDQKAYLSNHDVDRYTLEDILSAFRSPHLNPRDHYETPLLKHGITKIEDLKVGMAFQGTVRNVVDFGAFVDIGLKNDGLVHISKMTKQFIKHPLEVVHVGDIITVYVEKVDVSRGKVSLTMLSNDS